MRFPICALLTALAFSFTGTVAVQAHGPAGPGHTGARPGNAGFKPGGFEGRPGLEEHLRAQEIREGANRNIDKLDFSALHPNAAQALKSANGSSSGSTVGALHSNTGAANPTNSTAGGSPALLGNGALSGGGNAASQHRLMEIIGFLEMARHSSDPQLAAKADQILQQIRQHIALEHSQLNQGGSTAASAAGTTAATSASGGSSSTPAISHVHPSGSHIGQAGGGTTGHGVGHSSH